VVIVAFVSFLFKRPLKMNIGHNKLKIGRQNTTYIIGTAAIFN